MEALATIQPPTTPITSPLRSSPSSLIVRLPESTFAQISKHCAAARRRGTETQFYLLGERDDEHITILVALRAGNPIEGAGHTQPDFGNAAMDLVPYYNEGYKLLGEGHRHPDGFIGPSGTDLATLTSIDADLFPGYVCLVASALGPDLALTAHTANPDGSVQAHTVAIVPDASIRSRLFYHPLVPNDRQDATIIIIGLGTLGCQLALHAAKLKPKKIILIDNDRLERRNLDRHFADQASIGKHKVTWAKRFLKDRGSRAAIETHRREINPANRDWLTRLATTASVIVDATGHPVANHLTSEIGREIGKPVIVAGVFTRGSGGFAFRQDTIPTSPCYACLYHLTRKAATDDTATMDLLANQYGFTPAELQAHVGLFSDATVVASLQAKLLLDLLRREPTETDPNLWVIDNALVTVTRHRVQQDPQCPTCHPETIGFEDAIPAPLDEK